MLNIFKEIKFLILLIKFIRAVAASIKTQYAATEPPSPATKEEAKAIEQIKEAVASNPKPIDLMVDKQLKDLNEMHLED